MAIAPNGDVLLLVDFYPECKGLHKRSILDKKKAPYALYNKEMRPTLYDRDGKFYVIDKSGHVLNHRYTDTGMTVDYESGELYSGEAYLGNIHLNGKSPSNINEAGAKTTFDKGDPPFCANFRRRQLSKLIQSAFCQRKAA